MSKSIEDSVSPTKNLTINDNVNKLKCYKNSGLGLALNGDYGKDANVDECIGAIMNCTEGQANGRRTLWVGKV